MWLAARGDTEASSELYRRYAPSVRAVCRLRLQSTEAAEDAVQETFTRALAALPRFVGGADVGHWLRRIARNLCTDIRRRKVALPLQDEAWAPLVDGGAERALDGVLDRAAVRAALGVLPARDAHLLVAHHVDGRPLAELATELDLTPGSVAVIMSRARGKVRRWVPAGSWVLAGLAWLRRVAAGLRQNPTAEQAGQLLVGAAAAGVLLTAFVVLPHPGPERTLGDEQAHATRIAAPAVAVRPGAAPSARPAGRAAPVVEALAAQLAPVPPTPVGTAAPTAPPASPLDFELPVPGTDHGVGTTPHDTTPDYAYGVDSPVGGGLVPPVGSSAADEPLLAPVDALACSAVALLPGGYCEAPGP